MDSTVLFIANHAPLSDEPIYNSLVDFSSVDDPQNPNFISDDLEYDAVISNPEPPIAFSRVLFALVFDTHPGPC